MTTRFEVPGDDAATPGSAVSGDAVSGDAVSGADNPPAEKYAVPAIASAPEPDSGVADVGDLPRSVPEATVARLATYLRVVASFEERGVDTVSSEELAVAAGVNSAKLRKDLSHLGSYGVRGVGYSVSVLSAQLASTLGLREHHRVALIGVGNLGQALSGYDGFATRGFEIAALLDAAAERVGTSLRGLTVRHIDDLADVVRSEGISIGIIATPAAAAQEVADALSAAGVTAILNFAPTVLSVPESVDVRKVDLAAELQILSFHEKRKAHGLDALGNS